MPRKYYRRSKGGAGSKGFKRKVVRAVRSIAERKWVDKSGELSPGGSGLGAHSLVVAEPVNAMVEGTGVSERVGKKVFVKYLNINLSCVLFVNAGGGPPSWEAFSVAFPAGATMKFWLVYDKINNGGTPTESDLWVGSGTDAQRNHDRVGRFHVLREWTMSMSPGVMCPCLQTIFVRVNKQIEFITTGANAAAVEKGAIWLFRSMDPTVAEGSGTQRGFKMRYQIRCVFQDV